MPLTDEEKAALAKEEKEKKDADKLAALEKKSGELEAKIKEGEIKGMSESTGHALLTSLEDVQKGIKELSGRVSVGSNSGKGWWPF